MDREALLRANQELLAKRKELGIGVGPVPLATPTLRLIEQVNGAERDYLLALEENDISRARQAYGNTEYLDGRREKWDCFDSDRHPDLQRAVKTIKEWYNTRIEQGGALVIAGNYGTGKSHMAGAIHQLFGFGSMLLEEEDFVASIQDTYGGNGSKYSEIKSIRRSKLLVYDDLGTYPVKDQRSLKWLQGLYFDILNKRQEEGKATLITTNLNDDGGELEERLGPRCYDRLCGALEDTKYYIDLFDVPSYRRRNFS